MGDASWDFQQLGPLETSLLVLICLFVLCVFIMAIIGGIHEFVVWLM